VAEIKEALGHSILKTTKTYLAGFDNSDIDDKMEDPFGGTPDGDESTDDSSDEDPSDDGSSDDEHDDEPPRKVDISRIPRAQP
jgi:hypothetical protein